MEKQQIECDFKNQDYHFESNIYACMISKKNIISNSKLEFIGVHKEGKINRDVEIISFDNCVVKKVPQGLTKIFQNLRFLKINTSQLQKVEREDFKEYSQLKGIDLSDNSIEYLPRNLFADINGLQYLNIGSKRYCSLKIVDPSCYNWYNLKYINLYPCIEKQFDSTSSYNKTSAWDVKKEIQEKFDTPSWRQIFSINQQLQEENQNLKQKVEKLDTGLSSDLVKIIQNEKFKDFTVTVNGEDFKVHKLLLAARSSTFAEMIETNTGSVNLTDISTEIFREILKFFYTDELPQSSDVNSFELYSAAGRFNIEKLKNFAAEKLIDKVNAENVLEVLTLGNAYGNDNLRKRSLEEVEKMFPNKKFKAELKVEKLKALLEVKKQQEEFMKKLEVQIDEIIDEESEPLEIEEVLVKTEQETSEDPQN